MYPGGKGSCYQKLINQMPPHRVYVEAFLGSGAIMANKRPAQFNVGIEINPKVLRETAIRFSPGTIVTLDDGRASSQIASIDEKFCFVQGDALQFLFWYQWRGDELVYCDPPYVRSTRKTKQPIYEFEYTDEDHQALLTELMRLPCYVMISGYWSKLYADLLSGWRAISFDSVTRGGSMAKEWLWMNYDEPDALHDYDHLGDDYRERERIKRKKTRWVEGLRRMDMLERKAILSQINAEFRLGQHRHN